MWFETLTGFREESGDQVRRNIVVDGETMTSQVNGRRMICGSLQTPTLATLRSQCDWGTCRANVLESGGRQHFRT